MRIQFIISFLILSFGLSIAHADSWLGWSEFGSNGKNIQIYITRESGGKAGPIRQITHHGMNVTPALLAAGDELWVAWVDRADKHNYRLRYVRIDTNTQQILSRGALPTGDSKVYSPTLALSPQGDPVMAWTGLYNEFENIRLAYFHKGQWTEEQVITRNQIPDTSPYFSSDKNGNLTLSWEQISANGSSTVDYPVPGISTSKQVRSASAKYNSSMKRSKKTRKGHSFSTLPASLQSRQSQFLMGSQIEIAQ